MKNRSINPVPEKLRATILELNKVQHPWISLLAAGFLASYAYVFMEWLFLITKPSFMSVVPFTDKLEVLFFTGSLVFALCSLLLFPAIAAGHSRIFAGMQGVALFLGCALPAAILALMALMMIDNFTYTVLRFGIVSTAGVLRGLYLVLLLVLFLFCLRATLKLVIGVSAWSARLMQNRIFIPGLIGLNLLALAMPVFNYPSGPADSLNMGEAITRPNILVITADGLNADHMSLYGYERDTTPNLKELAETSLVAENAFSNSGNTGGSIMALFTGKYPTTTRVLYPPDILRGKDAYQHLPGILRVQGYHNVQISVIHYADAYTFNLQGGFEMANKRTPSTSGVFRLVNEALPSEFAYFIYEAGDRLVDRLRHITYIKKMTNPYLVVLDEHNFDDQDRLKQTLQIIQKAKQPFFVEVHFMGTHGEKFYPEQQIFSAGKDLETQQLWDQDLYDDSILEFDRQVGKIIDTLKNEGLWDETILVIGSDHGQQYVTDRRIPLLIHFPHGEHAESIRQNVQNIDIPVTLLDYLGLEIPEWMEGDSLLAEKLPERPLIGAAVGDVRVGRNKDGRWETVAEETGPPFYQFGRLTVITCDRWHRFNLKDYEWSSGEVIGSTSSCTDGERLSEQAAYEAAMDHLEARGFDTTDFVEKVPPSSGPRR